MKDIHIKFIPHAEQRYDTLGDYEETSKHLNFYISEEMGDDYCFLVAVHELIEAYLCKKRGIKWGDIDAFDIDYEKERNNKKTFAASALPITEDSEPGDDPAAPYYKEHQFASCIERLLANEMGKDWHVYEQDLLNVLEFTPHKDRYNE